MLGVRGISPARLRMGRRQIVMVFTETPENNINYEYGSYNSGNQAGRITKQEDINGIQQFTYGLLGEILTEKKTMIVPFDSIYTFKTRTRYDTWNRIDTIIYPDGEIVKYFYNEGGQLKKMTGVKGNQTFNYIRTLGYDKFESRSFLRYGDNTETKTTYDSRRRHLNRLQVVSPNINHTLLDNRYTFDGVDNILTIKNHVSPYNTVGGATSYSFGYDSSYRLTGGTGYDLSLIHI